MVKKKSLWFALFFTLLAIISMILYFISRQKDFFADELVPQISSSFKQDLKTYLQTADRAVLQLKKDEANLTVDEKSSGELHRYFTHFIDREKYLQGVIIFGSRKNYVIYRDDRSWVTAHSSHSDSLLKWTRLNGELTETGNWFDTYNFFMVQQQMDILRITDLETGEYIWRTAVSRNNANRDLFFLIFKLSANRDNNGHIALMYRTRELGNMFATLRNYASPLVTVLTLRGEQVTPIRTDNEELIEHFKVLGKEVESVIEEWGKKGDENPVTASFIVSGNEYWTSIDTLSPSLGVKGFAITLSQDDLQQSKKNKEEAYLYATLLFLIFALALALPAFRKQVRPNDADTDGALEPLTPEEVGKLIRQGESEKLEFKSSVRWDYRQEIVNRDLEAVILKSIAAFANAKGGILIIGIRDDLTVLGLEPDFKSLKKQDVDYFELHLRTLVNNQFG
ncbi:MAG: ATP-binding protein [bacterium]